MAIWASFRQPFTTQTAYRRGITHAALKWGVATGRFQRVSHGVYVEGSSPPNAVERALAPVVNHTRVARGTLAGVLHGLDLPDLRGRLTRPKHSAHEYVGGFACSSAEDTLRQLARVLTDLEWEQALESALRKELVRIDDFDGSNDARIRRVARLRPSGAPPTGSLLETLMVQLIRTDTRLPTPQRQVEVRSSYGTFIARVDLAWPEHGLFLELDGQQHQDQPVYDARRETAVVAAEGWLPGRFTWYEVKHVPKPTLRRVVELFDRARSLRQRKIEEI